MNKEYLLTLIKQEFKDITLDHAYTLLEENYYDTGHWYFDEKHINSNLTREEWDKNVISWIQQESKWFPEDIKEAIQAIQEKRKMSNRFPNPLEIPYEYLEHYYIGFTSLQSQAFLFYTPSIMISALKDLKVFNSASFQSWIFCLTWIDIKELLKDFKKVQVDILFDFLIYTDSLNNMYIDKKEIKNSISKIKLLKSHSKEELLQKIRQEFRYLILGDAYTLVEEDYADTSHWYFDKEHTDSNLTSEEWNKQEIDFLKTSNLFQEDIKEAIQAIQEKRKMSNKFPNPLEIPYEYLNKYRSGFMFLKPQAFVFYTPSIMIHQLCNPDYIDGFSFNCWLNTLIFKTEDFNTLLIYFNKKQISILIDFLRYLIDEFDEGDIQKALNKIQSLKFE